MRATDSADHRLTIRAPRSPIRWIGLPFALAACLPLAGALGLVEFTNVGGGETSPVVLALFSLPFFAVGLGLMFFQSGVTIDLEARSITAWRRVLVPVWSRTRQVDGFDEVTHFSKVIRSQNSSRTVYPVELRRADANTRSFALVTCPDEHRARLVSEQVAKLLALPVVNRTGSTPVRREFDELDLSLRDKRKRDDAQPELGSAPPNMRSHISAQGDELHISIPSRGLTLAHLGVLGLGTIPLLMAGGFVLSAGDPPFWFSVGVFAIAGLPVLGVMGFTLNHARRSWHVRVSPRALVVQSKGLFGSTVEIPTDQLEELHVVELPGSGNFIAAWLRGTPILAVADDARVSFANSVSEAETRYLATVIGGVASADSKP